MSTNPAAAILSPCVGVCTLDGSGLCIGCLRTMQEIGAWSMLSEQERRRIMDQVLSEREADRDRA